MAELQSGKNISEDWLRTSLNAMWLKWFLHRDVEDITKSLFLQVLGNAAFIKQKVWWQSTIYMISIFHLQRLWC